MVKFAVDAVRAYAELRNLLLPRSGSIKCFFMPMGFPSDSVTQFLSIVFHHVLLGIQGRNLRSEFLLRSVRSPPTT